MSSPTDAKISCPSCNRAFKWDRELAGCSIECSCGRSFEFPFNEPGGEEEVYDLDAPVAAPAKPAAVQTPRVIAYRQARPETQSQHQTVGELIAEAPMKSMILPIILIIAALAGRIIVAFHSPLPGGTWPTFLSMLLTIAASIITIFVGVIAVARFMGTDLHSLPIFFLRLTATAMVGNFAFAAVIAWSRFEGGMQGPIIALHLVVLVHWVMLSYWLDFDLQESLFAVAVVGLMQGGLACVVWPK